MREKDRNQFGARAGCRKRMSHEPAAEHRFDLAHGVFDCGDPRFIKQRARGDLAFWRRVRRPLVSFAVAGDFARTGEQRGEIRLRLRFRVWRKTTLSSLHRLFIVLLAGAGDDFNAAVDAARRIDACFTPEFPGYFRHCFDAVSGEHFHSIHHPRDPFIPSCRSRLRR